MTCRWKGDHPRPGHVSRTPLSVLPLPDHNGTNHPQFGLVGDYVKDGAENAIPLIKKVIKFHDLGFSKYTENTSNTLDLFCITAFFCFYGLPPVVRFFTVKSGGHEIHTGRSASLIIYLTAPAQGCLRAILLKSTGKYQARKDKWESRDDYGSIKTMMNHDYRAGDVFAGKPTFDDTVDPKGHHNSPMKSLTPTTRTNDKDIIVLSAQKWPDFPNGLCTSDGGMRGGFIHCRWTPIGSIHRHLC